MLEDGDRIVVARGGRGGKGNSHFATATHQSPREYQPGEDGEARTLELELKLIADMGLVGQPNAGKSTLLSVISAARPKIGDYPFTTLSPNLGVVQLQRQPHVRRRRHSGDHRGRARGPRARTAVPAPHRAHARCWRFSFPIDAMDWQAEYDQLRREIEAYSEELAQKPHCVVFTKMDLLGDDEPPPIDAPDAFGVFAISAAGRTGLDPLLAAWWSRLLGMKKASVKRDESVQLP